MIQTITQKKTQQTNSKVLIFKVTFDSKLLPDISDRPFWEIFGQQFREELTKKRSNNHQYITGRNKINKMVLSIEDEESVLVYVTLQEKCRSRIQSFQSCHYWKAELCKGPNKSRVPPNETFMNWPLVLFDKDELDNNYGLNIFEGSPFFDLKSGFKRPFPISNNENNNADKCFISNSGILFANTGIKNLTMPERACTLTIKSALIDPLENLSEGLKNALDKKFKPDLRYFREKYNEFLFGFDPKLAESVKTNEKDISYHIMNRRLTDAKSTNIHRWKLAKIVLDCRHGLDLKLKESIQNFEIEYCQALTYKERIILNDIKLYSLCQEIVSAINRGKGLLVLMQIKQIKKELDYLFGQEMDYNKLNFNFLQELQKEYDNDVFLIEQFFYMLASFYEEEKAKEYLVESAQNAIKLFRGDIHPVYYSNFGRDLVLKELIKKRYIMRKKASEQQNLMMKLLFNSISCMISDGSSIIKSKMFTK